MTTASGHTSAILASRVKGATVYNTGGDKIGHVEDVILDKQSDRIMFAALGFGGLLGMGEKYAPVPWSVLTYSKDMGGYVIPMSEDQLKTAPAYDLKDLVRDDGEFGAIRQQTYDYYQVQRDSRGSAASPAPSAGPGGAGEGFVEGRQAPSGSSGVGGSSDAGGR
jgi:sporulation protein YlmC with PRC-barrel domain